MLKPLSDNLIIKPLSKEKHDTPIVLPDSEKEKPEKGEVMAIGPGRILDNGQRAVMDIKVGDRVSVDIDKIQLGPR